MGNIPARFLFMISLFLMKSVYMKDVSRLTELVEKLIPYEESIEKLSEVAAMINKKGGDDLVNVLVTLVDENRDLKKKNESFIDIANQNQREIKELSERIDKFNSLINSFTQKDTDDKFIKENLFNLEKAIEQINETILKQSKEIKSIKKEVVEKFEKVNQEGTKKAIEVLEKSLLKQTQEIKSIKKDVEEKLKRNEKDEINIKAMEKINESLLAHSQEIKSINDQISLIKEDVEPKLERIEKNDMIRNEIRDINESLQAVVTEVESIMLAIIKTDDKVDPLKEDDIIDKEREKRRKDNKYTDLFNEPTVVLTPELLDDSNFNLEAFTEAIADSTKTGILTMSKLGDEKNQSLIKDDYIKYIAISLTKNSNFKYVYINNSQIGDTAVKYLCDAFKNNQNNTQVFLNDNQITDVGAKHIIELKNAGIKSNFNVRGNNINEALMKQIEELNKN